MREAHLIGSRACGTHRPDSHADVAASLRGEEGSRGAVVIDTAGAAFAMTDLDFQTEATPLWGAAPVLAQLHRP